MVRRYSRLVAGVLVILVVTIAVAAVGVFRRDLIWEPVRAPQTAITHINEGEICIIPIGRTMEVLKAEVRPPESGCFSSSCTHRYDMRADLWINPMTGALHFNSRFVYEQMSDTAQVCTRDCLGEGQAYVDLPSMASGYYTVWLGTQWLGEIEIGRYDTPRERVCISTEQPGRLLSRPTPTPLPPVVPTIEPYPINHPTLPPYPGS